MDMKMEELKELLTAIKQNTPPPSPTSGKEAPELPYDQPDNPQDVEQANAAGYYNSNGNDSGEAEGRTMEGSPKLPMGRWKSESEPKSRSESAQPPLEPKLQPWPN